MSAAEQAVLTWARSKPRGMGCPVMRTGREPGKECLVLDASKFDCDELASGPTWEHVAHKLKLTCACGRLLTGIERRGVTEHGLAPICSVCDGAP